MRTTDSLSPSRSDISLLNALLRRLSLPKWLWRTAVLLLAGLTWVWVCKQILIAGSLVKYDDLQSLGTQVVSFMTKINPYLWWAITIILTLIVLSLARAWLRSSISQGRKAIVSVADVQKLSQGLSVQAVDVLLWVWDQEAGPVTLGDLIAARDQIRAGRIRKLATARAQYHVLDQARRSQTEPVAKPALATRIAVEPSLDPQSLSQSVSKQ